MPASANAGADTAAPTLLSSPQKDHPVNADLVYTFDEPVRLGAGTITLANEDGVVYAGALANNPRITVSGNTISFNPPSALAFVTLHWVEFSAGAVTDLSGNAANDGRLLRLFFSSAPGTTPVSTKGTDGHDFIHGSDAADNIAGGEGIDELHGHGGDDTLQGDGWSDTLYGDAGNDKLHGGDHADKLVGGAGDDLLDGGSGDDVLEDAEGRNTLLGGDGKDTLAAGAGTTGTLDGGAGDDTLSGHGGVDLAGGAGNDKIRLTLSGAGPAASSVSGGDGDDEIQLSIQAPADAHVTASGGSGADTYLLSAGAVQTGGVRIRVEDFAAGAGGDQVNLYALPLWQLDGNPFANGALRLVADGANTLLQLRLDGAAGYRTLLELAGLAPSALTRHNFVGGIDPGGSNSGLVIRGTAGHDNLTGAGLDDHLYGEDGTDVLNGLTGNDLLDGGAGGDYLYGGAGNDRLEGGAGRDTLQESDGDNGLYGGADDDFLKSLGSGANLLDGGSGNDRLDAGNGQDTLLGGDGDDTLAASSDIAGVRKTSLDGGAGNDSLVLDIGVDEVETVARGGAGRDDFGVWSASAGLVIADFSVADGDTLNLGSLVQSQEGSNPFGAGGFLKAVQAGAGVQIWADRDGAAGSGHGMQLAVTLAGMQLSDLTGASIANGWHPGGSTVGATIVGTPGNDVLAGQSLDDTIRGGGGNDTLRGGEGNDVLEGGDENFSGDVLHGEAGNDTLRGEGGDDELRGGIGDDLLEGGAGGDQLFGGEGNDILRGGDGRDQLTDYSGNSSLDGGDGDDTIYTSNPSPYGSTEVLGQVALFGGNGNDEIYATMAVDEIEGGAGNDRISVSPDKAEDKGQPLLVKGNDGDDRMLFHTAADSRRPIEASGGQGRDTYQFSGASPAALTITDFVGGAGGDVLDIIGHTGGVQAGNPFGSGRARLLQRGADTVLQLDADGAAGPATWTDFAVLKNIAMAALTSENFSQGADPTGSNQGYVRTGTADRDDMAGGLFDDTLRGAGGNDSLDGREGNDTLYGDEGDDTLRDHAGRNLLDGGAGNDRLESDSLEGGILRGGAGNDWLGSGGNDIELDGGAGNDVFDIGGLSYQAAVRSLRLHGGEGDDRIELGASVGGAISVTADGGAGRDTYALAAGTPDILTILDFQAGEGGDLLDVRDFYWGMQGGDPNPFATGLLKAEQRGADTVLQARSSGDGVSAYQDVVILRGVAKADLKAGNVVLGFNPDGSQRGREIGGTAAADSLVGGWLNDTITGGAGDDQLWGEVGDDYLLGGEGKDILNGDQVREWPLGLHTSATGNDTLEGGGGDDELHSLWGNDILRGGDGNDTLRLDDDLRWDARTARVAMHGDDGADLFVVRYSHEASLALTLEGGAGRDTYAINWLPLHGSVTITDFQAGAGGDQIRLKDLPEPARLPADPFASGYLRFAQKGLDTVLELDRDGSAGSASFETLMLLSGVRAASLTAANIVEGVAPFVYTPAPGVFRTGTAGDDVVVGAAGDDWLDGGDGNDVLGGGRGNDVMIGGAGLDRADYGRTIDNYTFTRTANALIVQDNWSEGSGTDSLSGIERIAFATDWLAVDIDGAAGQAYRIYRAAFDRAPDAGGMGYWLALLDKGVSLAAIAAGFVASREFADLYGSAPTNPEIVTRLYKNILHRDPEPAGYAYWLDILDNKKLSLPQVLALISESAENQEGVAELIANGIGYTPYGG